MICEIWTLNSTTGDPELAGVIALSGGKVIGTPKARPRLFASIMNEAKGQDSEKWFHNLPRKYHGAYLHAAIVKG